MKSFSLDSPLVFVDVETTGASPFRDRVLDIGIIRVEHGKVVERFQTLLDPECSIPLSIQALTGIADHEVKAAPTFNDISHEIERLLDGAIFVAHNVRFDYAFIKSEFTRLGRPFSPKKFCTVALSRHLFPQYKRHDLSTIIDRYDFTCDARHRALPDAEVLVEFVELCKEHHGEEKCEEAISHLLGRTRVPTSVSRDVIDNLPEAPGVYIFYGEDGDKLYTGKSINIRHRVMSHFAGMAATGKALRMAEEVRDIEAITTTGELSALLLESHLIKKEQPLYNRMSRRSKKLIVAHESYKGEYKSINLETYETDTFTESEKVVGIFRSMSQAKKTLDQYVKEYKLCPRLMSLEKGKGPCFYSQLGTCLGACGEREHSEQYNARFDEAFKDRRVKTWPYKTPILIDEKSPLKGKGTVFIIDDWRLLGSVSYDEGGQSAFLNKSEAFDYDAYKILAQHLIKHQKTLKNIDYSEAERLLTF